MVGHDAVLYPTICITHLTLPYLEQDMINILDIDYVSTLEFNVS